MVVLVGGGADSYERGTPVHAPWGSGCWGHVRSGKEADLAQLDFYFGRAARGAGFKGAGVLGSWVQAPGGASQSDSAEPTTDP